MPTKNQLTVLMVAAVATWAVLLWWQGITPAGEWLKPFSSVLAVLMLLLSAFNLWMWKWPIFRRWLVKRPVVEGTWKVVLQTRWKNPETGEIPGPITGYMVIRQSYDSLSMRLMTSESSSVLLGAQILLEADGTRNIVGVYRNEPIMAVRERSRIHHGALLLQLSGQPASKLVGKYWTDRDTAGDMELSHRQPRVVDDFEAAARLWA